MTGCPTIWYDHHHLTVYLAEILFYFGLRSPSHLLKITTVYKLNPSLSSTGIRHCYASKISFPPKRNTSVGRQIDLKCTSPRASRSSHMLYSTNIRSLFTKMSQHSPVLQLPIHVHTCNIRIREPWLDPDIRNAPLLSDNFKTYNTVSNKKNKGQVVTHELFLVLHVFLLSFYFLLLMKRQRLTSFTLVFQTELTTR